MWLQQRLELATGQGGRGIRGGKQALGEVCFAFAGWVVGVWGDGVAEGGSARKVGRDSRSGPGAPTLTETSRKDGGSARSSTPAGRTPPWQRCMPNYTRSRQGQAFGRDPGGLGDFCCSATWPVFCPPGALLGHSGLRPPRGRRLPSAPPGARSTPEPALRTRKPTRLLDSWPLPFPPLPSPSPPLALS